MSISKWLDQSSNKVPKAYDAIVVGAGIAGLSVAYWLQKKDPNLKIAVIERHRVGFGASGRNAGFVTCGSTEHFIKLEKEFGLLKALEIWKFSEENHRLLKEEIIGDDGKDLDYAKTGSCTVAPTEERLQRYHQVVQTMLGAGLSVTAIAPSELESDYGVTGFSGGVRYAGDGYVDPVKLLNRLRAKLKIDLFEGAEVFSIEEKSGGSIVRTDQQVFSAEKIFLTVNAYLPLIEKRFLQFITPGRGQILMTEPLPKFVQGPCYLTKHLAYFRQLPAGHLLVGGFRNLATETENTYADETTELIQNALYDFIKAHFKFGVSARIAYQWAGTMGFSPDGQMLIGSLPDRPNTHVMAGCSGHGMGLSFHAAKTLVESAFGGFIPAHLSVRRFDLGSHT